MKNSIEKLGDKLIKLLNLQNTNFVAENIKIEWSVYELPVVELNGYILTDKMVEDGNL